VDTPYALLSPTSMSRAEVYTVLPNDNYLFMHFLILLPILKARFHGAVRRDLLVRPRAGKSGSYYNGNKQWD
jgi:hypothetical protein